MPVSRVDGAENGLPQVHPEAIEKARLAVCQNAEDVDDARILLDMLGLVPDPVRFPSVPVTDRGTRGTPAQPLAAPLPASRYGGGCG